MKIELDNSETEEAMAFYLSRKYNLNGDASVDIVKQPKTGLLTTTITLTPTPVTVNSSAAMASPEEPVDPREATEPISDDNPIVPEEETASIFGD